MRTSGGADAGNLCAVCAPDERAALLYRAFIIEGERAARKRIASASHFACAWGSEYRFEEERRARLMQTPAPLLSPRSSPRVRSIVPSNAEQFSGARFPLAGATPNVLPDRVFISHGGAFGVLCESGKLVGIIPDGVRGRRTNSFNCPGASLEGARSARCLCGFSCPSFPSHASYTLRWFSR